MYYDKERKTSLKVHVQRERPYHPEPIPLLWILPDIPEQ